MSLGGDIQQSPALERIVREQAVNQLRRAEGRMATLGSEDGVPKLDWVQGVKRLLDHPTWLEDVEQEGRSTWEAGVRHVIWAGMGGSVMTVRTLVDMGFCDAQSSLTIHPLDSTDPAALNEIVRAIAERKGIELPDDRESVTDDTFRALLQDVLMIGVSMGMTSEEPITHLMWFSELLAEAALPPQRHMLVMTLSGSYLDRLAEGSGLPARPIQLDGRTGTPGRMSAPSTRVFLLPVALYLAQAGLPAGQLRAVLQRAWQRHDLALAVTSPADHPFVQLAAAMSDASRDGICHLLLDMPTEWQALQPWIEQLMEESLGKGGKGILVFEDQRLSRDAAGSHAPGKLRVRMTTEPGADQGPDAYQFVQPYLGASDPLSRLEAMAASFLGWQLTMALYGYLHDITFAGQPAVENYKSRARELRNIPNPLQAAVNDGPRVSEDGYTLLIPAPNNTPTQTPAAVVAAALIRATAERRLDYVDLTFNGELPASLAATIGASWRGIAQEQLGVPAKLRRAPAAYHSTEQSEMDGPRGLISLRVIAGRHEEPVLGTYPDVFLQAQAVGTWQAMVEQNRTCFLLVLEGRFGEGAASLPDFLAEVMHRVREARAPTVGGRAPDNSG